MSTVFRSTQRGVVLFIALIVLVAMTLAGIALMRNVDTGTVIASNLGFRQTAVHVGDIGSEAARTWLTTTASASLYNDISADSYYATWQESIDLLGNDPAKTDFNWTSSGKNVSGAPTGYTVRYVIHRLCQSTGDPTGSSANCVKATGAASTANSSTKGAASYGSIGISVPTSALYRVTIRVQGPRNTLSYLQTTMY